MRKFVRAAGALALAAAALFYAAPAMAQGVTTASVRGRITDSTGAAVVGATIQLTNTSTGQQFQTQSRNDGRYNLENVPVGGPYTLTVKAIGFQPATRSGFRLSLGQVLDLPILLTTAKVTLAQITVSAVRQNPLTSPDRTGAQTFVSDSQIARYPLYNRNFTDILGSVPQASGTSINGQNNRFNNIEIDGGVNNDLFGLAASGTPGGQSGARPISVEAIREFQVQIAPFDVRQGGFTGGLVNAITKSGTNEFHGSLFGYFENQSLVGKDTAGVPTSDFRNIQYGFTLSGPIVRDKVQFFIAGDLRSYTAPFGGQSIGTDTTNGADSVGIGIRRSTALRIQQIIQNTYGFNPGGPDAPNLGNPDHNLFAKVTAQLGVNSQLEVSNNYVDASQDNLIHSPSINLFSAGSVAYGYELSNSGYGIANTTNSTRIKWNASFGSQFTNELLLSYQTVRDKRSLANNVPLLLVQGDRPGQYVGAGADRYSQGNFLNQNIAEVTDNFSIAVGRHLFTIGTHNEFISFDNGFFQASEGIYAFSDTTALKNNAPTYFQRAIDLSGGHAGEANWSVRQLGGYVQDQFSAARGLSITAGVRIDVPLLDHPIANPTLLADLGYNTTKFPSGNPLLSPRLGFNWDVSGDASTVIRGGVGLFAGRPPYVWLSNAFTNTGLGSGILVCTGANAPQYTPVLANVPTQCADGTTIGSVGSAGAVVFDPSFKFPRAAKLALGVDRNLGWGVIGTVDFLYTKWVDQMYINDANLQPTGATASGEGGRVMYGTIDPANGRSTPNRITSDFREVLVHTNKSSDRSYSITAQLAKHFADGVEFDAAYTYSNAKDLMSLTSSIASSNFKYNALDGTLANRNLANSDFNVPNSIKVSGSVNIPFGIALSLVYSGQTGSDFTYMVSGDVNGDGWSTNDAVYVPKTQTDITLQNPSDWTALNDYITNEPCLQKARGTILPRNSCHNSWVSFLDMRLAKSIPTVNGQNVTVTVGVFNVLNLLNKNWGLVRQTSSFDTQNLLRAVGYDVANQRAIYTLSLPVKNYYSPYSTASRWKIQLGLKYSM